MLRQVPKVNAMLTGSANLTVVSLEAARNPTLCAKMIRTMAKVVSLTMIVIQDAAITINALITGIAIG